MQALEHELKVLIIDTLNLEDVAPDDIESENALFGEGLGLDSIDALELGLALRKVYGITMSADSAENRKHFASVKALSEFVAAERTI